MRLDRFRSLAASFGGDLRRWPDTERNAAEALLASSAHARTILDDTAVFDRALADASAASDARLDDPVEQNASLARLRAGVGASLAAQAGTSRSTPVRHSAWPARATLQGPVLSVSNNHLLLVAGCGVSVLAGLAIGLAQAPPVHADLFGMLQTAPIIGPW